MAEAFPIAGIVRQHRKRNVRPLIAATAEEAAAHEQHFRLREEAEKQILGAKGFELKVAAGTSILDVYDNSLAGADIQKFATRIAPDVLITLGCTLVGANLTQGIKYCLNLHLGMAPRYRGAAGLFWPIYNMEPERIATSLLVLENNIDGGPIVHHSRPEMAQYDGIHEIACKTIVAGANDLVKILGIVARGEPLIWRLQKSQGRVYYESAYHPRHLRVTDFLMANGLIADYLASKQERDRHVDLVRHPGIG